MISSVSCVQFRIRLSAFLWFNIFNSLEYQRVKLRTPQSQSRDHGFTWMTDNAKRDIVPLDATNKVHWSEVHHPQAFHYLIRHDDARTFMDQFPHHPNQCWGFCSLCWWFRAENGEKRLAAHEDENSETHRRVKGNFAASVFVWSDLNDRIPGNDNRNTTALQNLVAAEPHAEQKFVARDNNTCATEMDVKRGVALCGRHAQVSTQSALHLGDTFC